VSSGLVSYVSGVFVCEKALVNTVMNLQVP
jgi:hypothetical protein